MREITIRPALESDCHLLGIVGPAAYCAAYHYLWSEPAALARHLETFGELAFHALMARPEARLWVAECDAMPVGFLTMLIGSPDPIEERRGGAEIARIFLLPTIRRKGVGRRLLNAALEEARKQQLHYVWLDAMDSAGWALATYENWGFQRIGTTVFPKAVTPEFAGMVVFRTEL